MTRRQTLNKINQELKQARQDRDVAGAGFWQVIRWMADRPSMKAWTVEQLVEQYHKTHTEHNITTEYIEVGVA